MIGGGYATFGGLLPAAGARAIFGDPATIAAGAFRPTGVAREVDGGYRVTGRWSLASGSSHATWYVAGCTVLRDDQPVLGPAGVPLLREVFVPAPSVEVIDTWESTGLRGTASHDYAVADVFVPAAHTLWFQDPPHCDRALYRMPPIAMFVAFIGAVPLGIARHALEAFAELAAAKATPPADGVLADRPAAQAALGRAQALVAAGRAYLLETLSALWARVQAGHAPSLADRGALWLAATARRPQRAGRDPAAVHGGGLQRRVRDQPARSLPARRPDGRAARRHPGDQLRARRPAPPGAGHARQRLGPRLPRRRLTEARAADDRRPGAPRPRNVQVETCAGRGLRLACEKGVPVGCGGQGHRPRGRRPPGAARRGGQKGMAMTSSYDVITDRIVGAAPPAERPLGPDHAR